VGEKVRDAPKLRLCGVWRRAREAPLPPTFIEKWRSPLFCLSLPGVPAEGVDDSETMLLAEATDEARPPRFFLPLPFSSWSPKPSVGVSGRVSEYRRLRAESVKAPPSVGGVESEKESVRG